MLVSYYVEIAQCINPNIRRGNTRNVYHYPGFVDENKI